MWLKSLEIIGWQEHDHLKLDFINGMNIIYGRSGAGKSCIRRAIAWVCGLEEFAPDDIRKEGSKKTSVKATWNDDTTIERIRSASINRAVLQLPGHEPLTYDAIGKELPEEVQAVLKMKTLEIDKNIINLNISNQVELPFLIEKFPASARMKLFNKLTGNDLLDVVSQNFNKEIIGIRRNISTEKEVINTNGPEIEKLTSTIDLKQEVCKKIKSGLDIISLNYQNLLKLKELSDKIRDNRLAEKNTTAELAEIKIIDEAKLVNLKAQITFLGALETVKEGLNTVNSQLDSTSSDLTKIKAPSLDSATIRANIDRLLAIVAILEAAKENKDDLAIVSTDLAQVKEVKLDPLTCRLKIEKFTTLRELRDDFNINFANRKQVLTQEKEIQDSLPKLEQEWTSLLKEAKICPVCKQDTSKCGDHV